MIFPMPNALMKSRKRFANQTVLLLLSGFSLSAFALQPLITDDTVTQGDGGNQIELSFNDDRAKTSDSTQRTQVFPVVYTRGLSETIDVFAALGHVRIRSNTVGGDANGTANPVLGVKWRFYENEDSKTSFAFKPEIFLPVSRSREEAGIGNGKTSGALTLILTQEFSSGAIHANAGVSRFRFSDTLTNPDETVARLSIAPVWNVSEECKLALDVGTWYGRSNENRVRTDFVEVGAIYSPDKDIDVALGLIRTQNNNHPRTTGNAVTAGLTWRFK